MAQSESTRRKPKFRERNVIQAPPVEPAAAPKAVPSEAVVAAPTSPRATALREEVEPAAPVRRVQARAAAFPAVTVEQALYAVILIAGFTLRIWDVGSRAMHGDEAVHAWMAWNLYNGTGYNYDPVYHGPLQFLVTAAFFFLFGVSETTGRLMAVLFGTGLIALPAFFRSQMGRAAALLASAYIAFSPAFVYVSRLERDDIFTAVFAMTLAISIFGYVRTRRVRYVYIGAASAALSLSAMENTYITLFVFGSFLLLVLGSERLKGTTFGNTLLRWWQQTGGPERVTGRPLLVAGTLLVLAFALVVTTGQYLPLLFLAGVGLIALVIRQAMLQPDAPYLGALRSINRVQWFNAFTIILAILLLTFSTFGSNLHGIWDAGQPIFNTGNVCPDNRYFLNGCRKDILGGLFYWLSQHQVHRGGQPWFYYTLLFGLYEQIAVIFGTAGIIWFLRKPTLFTAFLTYWAILMFGIYSWAGEKFPWLMIHPLVPFALLAAMLVADVVRRLSAWRWVVIGLAAALALLELHSMFEVNYVYGADPVEMMVYVQSAPDTPKVASQILELSNKVTNGPDMPVTIDSLDSWPFAWYLRNLTHAAYPSAPELFQKPYSTNPVIIVDESHQATLAAKLGKAYSGHRYVLRWWFPEDYKALTWASAARDAVNPGYWNVIAQWLVHRRPFGPKGAVYFYLYIKHGIASPY